MKKYLNYKAVTLMICVLLLFVTIIYIELLTDEPLFINEHLHITLEIIGSVIIIVVGILLSIYKYNWGYNISGFIIGFLIMGILDLFHSNAVIGNTFVYLHSIAGVFGGAGILVTVFMTIYKKQFQINIRELVITLSIGISLGIVTIIANKYVPIMIDNDEFTSMAVSINLLAGVLFIFGTLYFYKRLLKSKKNIDFIFFASSFLMGISSITFQLSELWCLSWWIWHILRLIAYIILLGFILIMIEANRKHLYRKNHEIVEINKKLNEYSYIISHDLKEPIRSIRTFSEFILDDYEEIFDETGRDYFDRIIVATNKMASMIDDLLVLSRIGRNEIEFRKIKLGKLIEEVEHELSGMTNKNNIVIHYGDLPEINCQPVWLKIALTNLVGNAIKYSDEAKEIVDITIKVDTIADKYLITISDNGIGIDSDQHEKIFGLFRRAYTKKNKEGSGAGLAIVRSIVHEHGGEIWVENSQLGVGTSISFTIRKNEGKHG